MVSLLSLVHRADAIPMLPSTAEWGLAGLQGRLCELGGGAAATLACGLLYEAQQRGESTAWISDGKPLFFPPDVHAYGIDLRALQVVRTPDASAALRASAELARSGAFALLIVDVQVAPLPMALMTRLLGLAQKHEIAVMFLCDAPLGSLISLRGHTELVRRTRFRFDCVLQVTKDKRRAPGWRHVQKCHASAGLH